jgi:hypothetical protein
MEPKRRKKYENSLAFLKKKRNGKLEYGKSLLINDVKSIQTGTISTNRNFLCVKLYHRSQ